MRSRVLLLVPIALLVRCGGTNPGDLFGDAGDASTAIDATTEAGPPACAGSLAACAGEGGALCVDLTKDPTHCGSCDVACGAKQVCQGGKCIGCDQIDADGDGYDACVDCNDADPSVNPGAFDVPGNSVDDDCNGKTDDVVSCDANIPTDTTNPVDLAHAMEMCDPWVQAASFPLLADDRAHQAAPDWGVFTPRAGVNMAALSTGVAADENDTKPAYAAPQAGTSFGKMGTPLPVAPGTRSCVDSNNQPHTFQDPTTVNDYTELSVTLKVPTNAYSFSIDLDYLTTDAPEWLCTAYVDQALVILESKNSSGNVLLDSSGARMTADSSYLVLNDAQSLQGTGMEVLDGNGRLAGGATGWMTLTAPVTPGETIKLRLVVFDVQDAIYDSQLLGDHFRWSTSKPCKPATVDAQYDGGAPDGGC
jgi:hypothetical protein